MSCTYQGVVKCTYYMTVAWLYIYSTQSKTSISHTHTFTPHIHPQHTPTHPPTRTHRCCLACNSLHHPPSSITPATRHHLGSCSSNTNSSNTPRIAKHSVHSAVVVSQSDTSRGRRVTRVVGGHVWSDRGGCSKRCCRRVCAIWRGVY